MAHVCEECGASFQRPSRLLVHMRTHTGDRPFKCPCGRSYIRRQHLTRHQANCDGTPEPREPNQSILTKSLDSSEYFCPKCGSGPYGKKKIVWAHLAIVHGDRRFRCEDCSAAFSTNSKLERHRIKHHSLQCQKCAAMLKDPDLYDGEEPPVLERFESFLKLREHIRQRHRKTGFICPSCDQRFMRAAHLREHELRHTPGTEMLCQRKTFVCDICSPDLASAPLTATLPSSDRRIVSFTAKRNLMAHMRRVHSDEVQKFACSVPSCPAILSSKQTLTAHMDRHAKCPPGQPLPVTQRASNSRHRRPMAMAPPGAAPPPPKKRRRSCVPIKDLQEAWETDSQSSVTALLC